MTTLHPRRVTWRRPNPKPPGCIPVTRAHSLFGNPFRKGDPGVHDTAAAAALHPTLPLESMGAIAPGGFATAKGNPVG